MRRLIHFLLFVMAFRMGIAQPTRYGNEWIDYSKTYCKIYVTADGFYHIPDSILERYLPNLSPADTSKLVMVHNGLPIPIYVHTDSGGVFDSTAYIEFFGKKNIGDVDSVLYPQPGYQPHPYYSLFCDTSVYFLTVSSTSNNPRYVFVNNDTASIPSITPDQYFWFSSHVFYTASNSFCPGRAFWIDGANIYKALYDREEGFGGSTFSYSSANPVSVTIPVSSIYTAGPAATINVNIYTSTWEMHNIVTTFNGNPLQTFSFDNTYGGFDQQLISQQIAPSALLSSNVLKLSETYPSTSSGENQIEFSEILYPRLFQFDNTPSFHFSLPTGTGERYFQVSNFSDGGTRPLVYDMTNGYIIRSTDAPGVFPKKFVLPPASGTRDLFIRDDNSSTYTLITRMDTVTFQNYTAIASQGNYMVITNKALCVDSNGVNYVQEYVNYRNRTASPATGHIDARLFDIDQITDQFGYGVKKTPLAIRNFVEYAYDKWSKKPEYLFLIGKGIIYFEARGSSSARIIGYNQDLVPAFGQPPSDNLLVCPRGSNRPLIAVGRLAAMFPTDVANYLDKVMTYEKQQLTYGDPYQNKADKLWMKQIMHLSGGTGQDEQSLFAAYLSQYEATARDTSWGANVYTVYKTISSPIDYSQAALIRQHVDSGLSLMTFFGHAAANAFDINVDAPELWTNYGKYPIIFANGCSAGSIDDPVIPANTPTFSQRFVLEPGKGAICFVATSNLSVSNGLDNFSTYQYYNICQNYYNKPWGKSMQYTQKDVDSLYNADDFTMACVYDMTLHGDPAISLNQYNLPDYQIDQSSLYFTPQTITAGLDSFTANIIVTNLGRAINDSMLITLTRSYPNPSNPASSLSQSYIWKVLTPHYIDTFSFKIPTLPSSNQGFGQNQFSVFVESGQKIPEISETNNGQNLQFGLSIQSNDIIPIYPYQFAIVPKQNLTVKASTANPFAPLQSYRLQVDTTALFLHPLAQTTIKQVGGVIHWTLPVAFRDSTVYYWRVSRDSINDTTSFKWHSSSFVYIKNEYPGWNQSHYYQYTQDNYPDNVYLDKDRVFKFVPTVNNITITTGYCTSVGSTGPLGFISEDLGWYLNSSKQYTYRMGGCGYANGHTPGPTSGGFTFAVLDTLTGNIWQSDNHNGTCNYGQFGNFDCIGKYPPQYGFDFNVIGNHPTNDLCHPQFDTMSWAHIIERFLDSIPTGSIVIMYAVSVPDYRHIDTNLVNKLAAMGATGLRNLCIDTGFAQHIGAPYIFWTMKGNPSWGGQATGHDYSTPLTASFNYSTLWNKGTYVSPTIGPAEQWGSFHWRWRPKQHPLADKQHVDIVGIQPNGTQVNLLSTTSLDTTLGFINAKVYPNIFLRMNVENDTAHVPSQLYYWRVLYKNMPEAAINPAAYFSVQRDTIGLGDTLNIGVALENVTDISMDSMRTRFTLGSLQNGYQQSAIVKEDSLRAGDTIILRFKQQVLNTAYSGRDQLTIEANPEDALHQPEEYHFNNYATVNFAANGDNVNPMLDVTFDDRRIMNGDIISAKPDIVITVRDENKYLALVDTSTAQIYVLYPGQSVPTLINYDNKILTFYPATGNIAKRNQATIEFKPTFTVDGAYSLLIRDKDESGNYSSSTNNRYQGTLFNGIYYDYKINFTIVTKPMISNVLNYPNPFSTRTQFVFTITGSQVPDYMKIQIMTITGKVVKEITKDQLGNLHVGVNLTDYYWDGHDQYGNKLANGVYFYRVIADIANKQMDNLSSTANGQFFDNTNIDKYFKHGFGKLVIMR